MAESPSHPPPPSPPQLAPPTESDQIVEYWCYQCDKRVNVEALVDPPQIVCVDCKCGFVESIAADPPSDPSLGNQFMQVLNLLAQVARVDDAPPSPPPERVDDDYMRIELDGWEEEDDEDEDEDEDEDDNEDENNDEDNEDVAEVVDSSHEQRFDDDEDPERVESDEELRRARRDRLRQRLRDFATLGTSRRERILDNWADILMGFEDHSIEFRFHGAPAYVGDPGDYVDAAGYETVLRNLAETDGGGRGGAPPAAESAVAALKNVEIEFDKEALLCAVCKDMVNVGEIAKELPCGHGYHGDCIVPWLASRNTCPVCRFELPTSDPDYEEGKKKKSLSGGAGGSSSSPDHIPGLE
ncbi:RING-type E3 ubiquitin transferase [Heracleum sosnowskyi]|uniref:RING-type E3 ubiquitin transferase n=1 Tax=Heracleum sosnowskyi TaxID=360622 RepID=A0AAD8H9S8_9APIA|nr:RING-type E3 ubiquitin transferase [Heracleum sosnowskyi]